MKVSSAALPFLILAAALGAPTRASVLHGSPPGEHSLAIHVLDNPSIQNSGVHRPTDCCPSYIPRNIRCVFMEDYYETSSGCSLPAVIFKTKRGQEVCVRPSAGGVRECMVRLDSAQTPGTRLVEEKLQ